PLLLRGAVPHDRQRADARMRAKRHRKAGQPADGFGDYGGAHFVQFQAAVDFGNVRRREPKLAGLAQQAPGYREILSLDLSRRRHNLVLHELEGGLRNLPVLPGEIFGCEYVLRIALLNQEAAAFGRFRHYLHFVGQHLSFTRYVNSNSRDTTDWLGMVNVAALPAVSFYGAIISLGSYSDTLRPQTGGNAAHLPCALLQSNRVMSTDAERSKSTVEELAARSRAEM